jgi:hypothetical protein
VPGTAIVTIVGTDPHGNQTSCSVQANVQSAGFTVGADPDSLTVIAGAESQPTSIFVTPMGAFTGPVTLVVTSITDPNGAAVTDLSDWALFDSSGTITSSVVSVPNSEIDTLEITAPPSVLAGVYSVTVTGTDSSGHTSAATINVDVPTGFSVTAEPGALTVAPGVRRVRKATPYPSIVRLPMLMEIPSPDPRPLSPSADLLPSAARPLRLLLFRP